jgi:hypothetical protein
MRVGVNLNQSAYGSSISGYSARSELIPNTKNLIDECLKVTLGLL